MKYGVYSVRDKKTDFYSPRVESTKEAAIRWFAQVVNAPNTMPNFAPEDFSLYKIGEFDSETGELNGFADVVFLCKAESVMKGEKESA